MLRIFYALEVLYPSVLHRCSALRWRVRPRGAAYQSLVASLRQLGRGWQVDAVPSALLTPSAAGGSAAAGASPSPRSKAKNGAPLRGVASSPAEREADGVRDAEGLHLPRITTRLWEHQALLLR